jgi:hypothetical protein
MADPAHIAAHDPDVETGPNTSLATHLPTPESDDETIVYTSHHRELIIRAGECARAEQQRPEKQLGLQNGRTARRG